MNYLFITLGNIVLCTFVNRTISILPKTRPLMCKVIEVEAEEEMFTGQWMTMVRILSYFISKEFQKLFI